MSRRKEIRVGNNARLLAITYIQVTLGESVNKILHYVDNENKLSIYDYANTYSHHTPIYSHNH